MLNRRALLVGATIAVSALVAGGCAPSTLRSLQFRNVRDVRILDITGSRMSMEFVADVVIAGLYAEFAGTNPQR